MPAETTAYVAVGSNLGDREAHIGLATARLQEAKGIHGLHASPLYQSAAIGPGVQPDYLNGVYELQTRLPPLELLELLLGIERAAGRTRSGHWAPRTLDLDLLLYGSLQQADPQLTIPHPRLATRNFVVYPLFDLAPGLRLPDGTPLAALRSLLPADGLRPAEPAASRCHA